jgi:hypothetical protein
MSSEGARQSQDGSPLHRGFGNASKMQPALRASSLRGGALLHHRPSGNGGSARRLIFGMPQGTALVWLANEEVPRVSRVKGYFEIAELNWRTDTNPYFRASGQALVHTLSAP